MCKSTFLSSTVFSVYYRKMITFDLAILLKIDIMNETLDSKKVSCEVIMSSVCNIDMVLVEPDLMSFETNTMMSEVTITDVAM